MRLIVTTVSVGYSPTAVSFDVIVASAPSSTALAQSEASARLGTGECTMEPSTSVATMTGLAYWRDSSMQRLVTSGTSSNGISTAMSPRATMMPSNTLTMSSRFSTACGFSILATIGMRRPSSSMISWARSMSVAKRTNDMAMMSAPVWMAQRRSFSSFSVRAGSDTATPGRLMPLWLETGPATTTLVYTLLPSTFVTSRRTLPSSMRIGSPGWQSPGRPLNVVDVMCSSPSTSSVVMMNSWPSLSCTLSSPSAFFLTQPQRILGP